MNRAKFMEKAIRLARFKSDSNKTKPQTPLKHASDNEDDRPQFYSPYFRQNVLSDPLFETYFGLAFGGALLFSKGLYNMISLF